MADFSKSTFWKAFNPKIFSSIQLTASFETNLASISSKRVEFDIFDCVIAFPEYVIAKFPAKLHVIFFHFFWRLNVPHTKLSLRKLSTSTGGQRFSTSGPPMAIDGILIVCETHALKRGTSKSTLPCSSALFVLLSLLSTSNTLNQLPLPATTENYWNTEKQGKRILMASRFRACVSQTTKFHGKTFQGTHCNRTSINVIWFCCGSLLRFREKSLSVKLANYWYLPEGITLHFSIATEMTCSVAQTEALIERSSNMPGIDPNIGWIGSWGRKFWGYSELASKNILKTWIRVLPISS